MRLPFLRLSARSSTRLVVELEGGSASCALVHLNGDEPLRVLQHSRQTLPIEKRDPEHQKAAVLDALKQCLERSTEFARTGKGGQIETVHIILRAPFVESESTHAERVFEDGHRIVSGKDISALARGAMQSKEGRTEAPFEGAIIQSRLNGYATQRPEGRAASTLAISALTSWADTSFRSAVGAAVALSAPARPVLFHSGARAAMTVMQEFFTHIHSYVFVDVATLSTDISIVRKEEIVDHARVPEGLGTILQKVRSGAEEEALSLLTMATKDACASPACTQLRESLASMEPDLAKTFGSALGKIAMERRLPNECVLLAHPALAPWLEHFIARIDFAPFTTTALPFIVEILDPVHLQKLVQFAPGTEEGASLALSAAFIRLYAQAD